MKTKYKILLQINTYIIASVLFVFAACNGSLNIDDDQTLTPNTIIDSLRNEGPVSVITLFPLSALAGDTVVISGYGFVTSGEEKIKVLFGGEKEGKVSQVSPTELRVVVPDTISKGRVKVWINQNTFAFSPFQFTPEYLTISSFFPMSGIVGETITINGTGFRIGQTVYFNETIEAETEVVNSTTIKAKVPSGDVSGKIVIKHSKNVKVTSLQSFAFETTALTITSVTPTRVKTGDKITITGTGFKPGEINKVYFGNSKIEGQVTVNSTTELTVIVPEGDVLGPLTIWQREGREVTFGTNIQQYFAPQISNISATIAQANTSITITGTHFPTGAELKVLFGTTEATVISSTQNSVEVTVPALATKDVRTNLSIKNVKENVNSNSIAFIVWNPAKVFSDDFNRANTLNDTVGVNVSRIGNYWTTTKGNNQIYNNMLKSVNSSNLIYNNPQAIISAGQKFNFAADAMLDHATATSSFSGLLFNYQSSTTVYQLFRFNGTGLLNALSTANGGTNYTNYTAVPAISSTVLSPGQTWYHFEISSEGTRTISIKISKMDGTILVNSTYDMLATTPGGSFGFLTVGNYGRFDNFSLLIE